MKPEINWDNTFKYRYMQIPKSGIQYVVLNKELKPVCNPFYCKEYFQDIIYSENTGSKIDICGLDYEKLGILDKYYVGIRWDKGISTQEEKLNIENIRNLIKQIEEYIGIKEPCEIEEAENGILLSPSANWTSNPVYSSVLLQSLRHTKKFSTKNDVPSNILEGCYNDNYKLQVNNGWLKKLALLNKGAKVNQTWKELKGNSCHNTGLNSINEQQLKSN